MQVNVLFFVLCCILFLFVSLLFRRGFYCWVIKLNLSSFTIILFAVDLRFHILVSNMSVVVILSFCFIHDNWEFF